MDIYEKSGTHLVGHNLELSDDSDEIEELDEDPTVKADKPVSQQTPHIVAKTCQKKITTPKPSLPLKLTTSSELQASNNTRSLSSTLALAFSPEAQNQKFEQNLAGGRIAEL